MILREATVADLPRIEPGAREFYSKSEFLNGLDMAQFRHTWTTLWSLDAGVIYFLEDDLGEIAGFIGGVRFPDPNTGRLVATECFWFVRDYARGQGWKLYRAFERWAKASKCRQIHMVHLMDSMPDELSRFYQRIGYKPMEMRFCKELPCV